MADPGALAHSSTLGYGVEGDGQAGLRTLEGDGAVPEVRWEEHEHAGSWSDGVLGLQRWRRQDARFAETENAFVRAGVGHNVGQLNIKGGGDPTARVNVARMEAAVAQSHRPAAIESPLPVVAAAEGIGAPADLLEVLRDGRREGLKERAHRGVGAA